MQILLHVNQNLGEAEAVWQWDSSWASRVSRYFTYLVYHDCAIFCNLKRLQPLELP